MEVNPRNLPFDLGVKAASVASERSPQAQSRAIIAQGERSVALGHKTQQCPSSERAQSIPSNDLPTALQTMNYLIGIDIGTQGARVVLLDECGTQITAKEQTFPLTKNSREEQSPETWWQHCRTLLLSLREEAEKKIPLPNIVALAVTSTSGTIIPIDHDYNPLHPAIMYSDPRSANEAKFCKEIAERAMNHGYTAFNSSSGLPKMRWFLNQYPELIPRLHKFIHAADFITGKLCGEYRTTDHTNALKSGYDLHNSQWPDYISKEIGIEKRWLQNVGPSGIKLGTLTQALADALKLPQGIIVTSGITDGCASQVASGAVRPGQWSTTLGTTMVIKGVSRQEVIDPTGAVYNHRHPSGYWMPGGASNTGADWVNQLFPTQDLQKLSNEAALGLPSPHLAWPLLQDGERFPFSAPHAHGFWPNVDDVEKFTTCMEGVAFIERYAYERILHLSGEDFEGVCSAGGGSKNDTWLRIRSSVLNRPVAKMKNVSGAAGAAILAAASTVFSSLEAAAEAMAVSEKIVEPESELVQAYDEKYQLFIEALKARNILQ